MLLVRLMWRCRPTARSRSGRGPWHHGPVQSGGAGQNGPGREDPGPSGRLAGYQASGQAEAADLARVVVLAQTARNPWSRSLPLHFTASALVVHPPSERVLLRWHVRLGRWLQVGGHADPGESDPLEIALREAREETGLTDLVPWPDAALRHVVICAVPASATEPRHEHADLRYIFATSKPAAITPENDQSPLRWLTVAEARAAAAGNNLGDTIDRAAALLAAEPG